MSLKKKYTWHDFKREKGKEAKDLKRTSPEGLKAFEAAQLTHMKDHLKKRIATNEDQKKEAEKELKDLKSSLEGLKSETLKKSLLKKVVKKQNAIKACDRNLLRDKAISL